MILDHVKFNLLSSKVQVLVLWVWTERVHFEIGEMKNMKAVTGMIVILTFFFKKEEEEEEKKRKSPGAKKGIKFHAEKWSSPQNSYFCNSFLKSLQRK